MTQGVGSLSGKGQKLPKLPDGWAYGTLEEVSKNIVDCLHSTPKFTDKGKYCIDTTCIEPGKILFDKVRFVPEDIYQNRVRRLIPEAGDILFAREGTIGTALVVPDNVELCLGQRMMMFRPASCILPKYYMWALSAPIFESQWKPKVTGTTAPHVNIRDLRGMVVPLAPIQQQYRIVNKIEELFTQLDAGVDLLKKLKLKLKRYRQAVLKAAVEGKLTQDWRESHQDELEPASVLLDRILKERRAKWEADQLAKMEAKGKAPKDDKWKLKYKEPAAPDTAELLELPESWEWVSLGQLTWFVKDGPHYSPKYATDGIPFITGGNVKPSGVDFVNAKKITKELHKELSQRCKPELGDILYTKGGTTGVARVNTYDFEFNVWVHVAVLKLAGPTAPFYVQHALNSPSCYAQSQRFTHGVGNQDLGLTRMVNIVLGLPPIDEQEIIITEIDRKMSLLDELDKVINKNLNRAEKLRQSILQKAFEGKLVPQDPNDEPASLLLERIQEEKAQREAIAKSKKQKTTPKKKKSRKATKTKQLEITDASNEEQAS